LTDAHFGTAPAQRTDGALLAVCVLMILYPVSYGPAYRLAIDGWLPFEALIIYEPLGWLLGDSPIVESLQEWYEESWSWTFDKS
jgi:hypothetical protein